MKLLYLWVEEYGILKDAEFNFDSNIRFHYDCEKNELKRIEAKNEIPKNFFSLNNSAGNVVESVSAIIGNNGAGKTSVFNLINKVLWNDVGINFILVFKQKKEMEEEEAEGEVQNNWFYFKTSGEYYKIEEFNSGEVLNLKDKNDSFVDLKKEDRQNEKPFTLIYHSSFFNPQRQQYEWFGNSNTIDISTTHLVINDYEKFYEIRNNMNEINDSGKIEDEKKSVEEKYSNNKIGAHSAMEFKRNIYFINKISEGEKKGKKFNFEFNYPTGVNIKINKGDGEIFLARVSKNQGTKTIINNLETIFVEELQRIRNNEKDIFILNLSRAILYNYLRGKGFHPDSTSQTPDYFEKLEAAFASNQWWEGFYNYFKKMSVPTTLEIEKKIPEIIEYFKALQYQYFNARFRNEIVLDLKKEGDSEHFKNIVSIYFKSNTITDYLLFEWDPPISAGEQSYLNIFSRFINIFETNSNNSDFVVFFDEIETTLHPELQRKIIKTLISFFNEFAPDKKVHLIFATHSPILLSDIPVDNCCFLKREAKSFKTRVVEEMEQTFGANIHSLFADSFFLNGGTIGDFAKNKINGLIQEIKTAKPEDLEENEKNIRNRIEMIGEPIIRGKVISILEERLSTNLISIYSKVRKIEKRLDNIEDKLE